MKTTCCAELRGLRGGCSRSAKLLHAVSRRSHQCHIPLTPAGEYVVPGIAHWDCVKGYKAKVSLHKVSSSELTQHNMSMLIGLQVCTVVHRALPQRQCSNRSMYAGSTEFGPWHKTQGAGQPLLFSSSFCCAPPKVYCGSPDNFPFPGTLSAFIRQPRWTSTAPGGLLFSQASW